MKTCKDQLNRKILFGRKPKRIVSLVPSQTELLVDLGLEAFIVGVTKFCVHPNHLRMSKVVVGGTKDVNIEKIKALRPDIILCNKEENTKEMIELLTGIAPIHISDVYNLEDSFELINMYGDIFEIERKASDLIDNIKIEREAFQLQNQDKENLKVAYFIWKKPWMVAASDNFIDVMIREAGFTNVFESEKRYPEIGLDNLKLKEADVIFLSSEPFPFRDNDIVELQSQFPDKTIKIVDGELFSWYGSRLLQSYSYCRLLQSYSYFKTLRN